MSDDVLQKVRLKGFEITAIRKIFTKHFSNSDHVWLFGSRANLQKRGGDIDLYIESTCSLDEVYRKRSDFIFDLCSEIGDQKIDVVVQILADNRKLPIYEVARNEGVKLA